MAELKTNVLYFGDNLEILRKYIPDGSIDLSYLASSLANVRGNQMRGVTDYE